MKRISPYIAALALSALGPAHGAPASTPQTVRVAPTNDAGPSDVSTPQQAARQMQAAVGGGRRRSVFGFGCQTPMTVFRAPCPTHLAVPGARLPQAERVYPRARGYVVGPDGAWRRPTTRRADQAAGRVPA